MQLCEYLETKGISQEKFGALIGVSQAAVGRYVNGERIPEKEVIVEIYKATDGKVTANDFYDLPHKKKNGHANGK